MNHYKTLVAAGFAGLSALLAACSFVLDAEVGKGIGEPCSSASDCNGEGAICEAGKCSAPCQSDGDCPLPSRCITQRCQKPLKAAFFYDGQVSNATTGFALTHEKGRQDAVSRLPWLSTITSESNTTDSIGAELDRALTAEDADVLVVTTTRFRSQALEKAVANPGRKFLLFNTNQPSANQGGYFARYYQAWYLAGVAAAQATELTTSKQIGFLGALPTPEVVAQFNAFLLGARSVNPQQTVEIVWANSFVPSEDVQKKMVDYLVEGGNEILVNRMGARNEVFFKHLLTKKSATGGLVYGIGLDNPDVCKFAQNICIGAPYWNWGPLYTRLLESIQQGSWQPSFVLDSIQVDPSNSTVHFALNTDGIGALSSIKEPLARKVGDLIAGGMDNTFLGPICPSQADQRNGCVDAGARVTDEEILSMCWFAEGAVQRKDSEASTGELVPARVPDGTLVWPPKVIDPNALDKPSCQ
jgi:basic membrane lipoprotein Med (substrate-binding protein (PBP1-ABC) superfamily)